jgi:hypothetical protein
MDIILMRAMFASAILIVAAVTLGFSPWRAITLTLKAPCFHAGVLQTRKKLFC